MHTRDDRTDPEATKQRVREIIAARTSREWTERFAGKDVCCNVVKSLDEAMRDPQFQARGVFRRSLVRADHDALPAVSVPIVEAFRDPRTELKYPRLAENNDLLG